MADKVTPIAAARHRETPFSFPSAVGFFRRVSHSTVEQQRARIRQLALQYEMAKGNYNAHVALAEKDSEYNAALHTARESLEFAESEFFAEVENTIGLSEKILRDLLA